MFELTAAIRLCAEHAPYFGDLPIAGDGQAYTCPFCLLCSPPFEHLAAKPSRYVGTLHYFALWICRDCGAIVDWTSVAWHNRTCVPVAASGQSHLAGQRAIKDFEQQLSCPTLRAIEWRRYCALASQGHILGQPRRLITRHGNPRIWHATPVG